MKKQNQKTGSQPEINVKMKSTDLINKCGFCHGANSVPLYKTSDIFGDEFFLNRCNICRAVFLAPPPTNEQIRRAYDDSYYGSGEEKFKEGMIEKMLDYFRRKRAKTVYNFAIKKSIETGHALPLRFLDIGCGNGKFLSFVKQLGKVEIYGIEPEGGSANRAEKIPEIHLKKGFLEKNDFEKEYFDAITLFHVFEHLAEPLKTIEIISEILKKNGILMMSFPNIDSFQSRLFKGRWLHLDPPRHLFFFSPGDFKNEMEKAGFEILRERHFSIEYNPFGFQQSLLNCIFKKREILYESLKGNKEYVKEFSKANLLLQNLFFKLSSPIFILFDVFESLFRKGATVEFVMRKK